MAKNPRGKSKSIESEPTAGSSVVDLSQVKLAPNVSISEQDREDIQISDEDKRNFTIAALTGRPFRKSYSILGGAATVTFQTIPLPVSELIRMAAAEESKATDFDEKSRWYTLACSLESVVPDPAKVPDAVPVALGPLDGLKTPGDVKARFDQLVERLGSSATMSILSNLVGRFATLVRALVRRATDPNF